MLFLATVREMTEMSVAAKVAFNGKSSALYKDKNRLKGTILVFMSNENDTQKSKVITPSLLSLCMKLLVHLCHVRFTITQNYLCGTLQNVSIVAIRGHLI